MSFSVIVGGFDETMLGDHYFVVYEQLAGLSGTSFRVWQRNRKSRNRSSFRHRLHWQTWKPRYYSFPVYILRPAKGELGESRFYTYPFDRSISIILMNYFPKSIRILQMVQSIYNVKRLITQFKAISSNSVFSFTFDGESSNRM